MCGLLHVHIPGILVGTPNEEKSSTRKERFFLLRLLPIRAATVSASAEKKLTQGGRWS